MAGRGQPERIGGLRGERIGNEGTTRRQLYAGFWHRVGGEILDALILLIPTWVLSGVVARVFTRDDSLFASLFIPWLVALGYYVVGNGRGGTFGKRLTKLRVVDAAGAVPGIRRGALRAILPYGLRLLLFVPLSASSNAQSQGTMVLPTWAMLVLLLILLLMAIDYLRMIWDPHKQTLHDKLAGTFVIRTGARSGA